MKVLTTYTKSSTYILISFLITFLIIFLLVNLADLSASVRENVQIFLYTLLPSIFPFIFLTNLLIESGFIYNMSYGMSKMVSRLFKIPICSSPTLIISLTMGYPNAAKFIATLYNRGQITSKQCEQLLAFTSNANPAYIISTVGIMFFNSTKLGLIFLISHILSSITLGIILSPKYKSIIQQNNSIAYITNKKNEGFKIISNSIFATLKTLGLIFCFMAIFSSITQIICNTLNLTKNATAVVTSIFEITNGLKLICASNFNLTVKALFTSFFLSFGSFMILYQIYSVVYFCRIKFISFVKHKIVQGILSAFYTYILLKLVNIQCSSIAVFSNIDVQNISMLPEIVYILAVTLFLIFLIFRMYKRKRPIKL